jgi:hypothetical protein
LRFAAEVFLFVADVFVLVFALALVFDLAFVFVFVLAVDFDFVLVFAFDAVLVFALVFVLDEVRAVRRGRDALLPGAPPDSPLSDEESSPSDPRSFFATPTAAGTATPSAAPAATF